MTPEGERLLLGGAEGLGMDLSRHLPAFTALHDLLVTAGETTNLTALKTERDIVLKHFVDSLSCTLTGDLDGPQALLDLGTGAGFPGLPLAITYPQLKCLLLDATQRKVAFVQQAIEALGLDNAQARVGRAEALGRLPEFRGQVDRVVARAVSALPVLIELALPLLKVGGRLVAQKGPIEDRELLAGTRAATELGGQLINTTTFRLPLSGDARTLVVVAKTRATSDQYPRREGVPAKHPLF